MQVHILTIYFWNLLVSIAEVKVICNPLNYSDHRPVALVFKQASLQLPAINAHLSHNTAKVGRPFDMIRWDKGQISEYYNYTGFMLNQLSICHNLYMPGSCCTCKSGGLITCSSYQDAIEQLNSLLSALILPKSLWLSQCSCIPINL